MRSQALAQSSCHCGYCSEWPRVLRAQGLSTCWAGQAWSPVCCYAGLIRPGLGGLYTGACSQCWPVAMWDSGLHCRARGRLRASTSCLPTTHPSLTALSLCRRSLYFCGIWMNRPLSQALGAKYVVLSTKHHKDFSNWQSLCLGTGTPGTWSHIVIWLVLGEEHMLCSFHYSPYSSSS